MAGLAGKQIVLRGRPVEGKVTPELFELVETPRPRPGDGELLIRILYLSLDPAMRGWIADAPNYRDPVPLGSLMIGFTVGQVTASNHPDYAAGEFVCGRQGWQEWAVSDGSDILRKVDPLQAPITTALHVMGHTGLTAYLGLMEIGRPKPRETVVVSTAAGAVGSMVGQIAKRQGCRTVGITGSEDKLVACRYEFGYDEAINYKTEKDLAGALAVACPRGVDVYFDNTGGPISDAVMEHLNVGARVIICGTMGIPDSEAVPHGPRPNRQLLIKRASMQGFLVLDHLDRLDQALEDLGAWVAAGQVAYHEDVTEGLENAPEALCRLLDGENTGKVLVRLSDDPTL